MFRGRQSNPRNRFSHLMVEWNELPPRAKLEITEDHTQSILARNTSPDLGFEWSVNPYRGCTHACAYCYARDFHEMLDLGAGTDFERKISVKLRAPELLRQAFDRKSWKGGTVAFSGATDAWQPLERRYEITRRCMEVCADYRQPITLITRSPLVVRDLDHLVRLAEHDAVRAHVSIPIFDHDLARLIEPGAAPPKARIETIRALSTAGIPVGLSLAPLIPGLTDNLVPNALIAAREAGARWAFMGLLRLPGNVAQVFEQRLRLVLPDQADKVLNRLGRARGGARTGSGTRMPGTDESWLATKGLFDLWMRKLGYESPPPRPPTPFQRPGQGSQLRLL